VASKPTNISWGATPRPLRRSKNQSNPAPVLANGLALITCRLSIVKQHIVHDSMPISMPTTWVVTTCSGIGEEDPVIIVALSHRRRPPAHTGAPTGTYFNGEDRPVRTSENSCRIGSLPSPCQALQQAPLSLSVLMDGEQSIQGGRCPFLNAPHVTTKALPLFPPV